MGRLLLFDDEQLVVRFRPHPFSYLRRYAGSFLWLAPGALGSLVARSLGSLDGVLWGLGVVAFVGFALTLANLRLRRESPGFPAFVLVLAVALAILLWLETLTLDAAGEYLPLYLGATLAFLRLFVHEFDRLGHVHYLTTDRLVFHSGLAGRNERTIPLKAIESIRGSLGVFGQAFDYGHLTLVLGRKSRGGKSPEIIEDTQEVYGVGNYEETKHHLETLVEESRLPLRDRRQRVEERRVKESMRLLAGWMRKQTARTSPP